MDLDPKRCENQGVVFLKENPESGPFFFRSVGELYVYDIGYMHIIYLYRD